MLNKFKEIFSSVVTVATARKLSKENFLLRLKECKFKYNNSKDTKTFYHILLKLIR